MNKWVEGVKNGYTSIGLIFYGNSSSGELVQLKDNDLTQAIVSGDITIAAKSGLNEQVFKQFFSEFIDKTRRINYQVA